MTFKLWLIGHVKINPKWIHFSEKGKPKQGERTLKGLLFPGKFWKYILKVYITLLEENSQEQLILRHISV